ncbi:MAG: hypothetical protein ACLFPU_04885 [Dehalococcoidia bacterium]
MNTALFIVIILILLALGLFVIPRFRMKRAVNQVIKIFQESQAISPDTAKTIDELGLRPPTFMQRLMRRRDFKPYALQALIQGNIIRMTEDDRLYLSEEDLASSNLYNS